MECGPGQECVGQTVMGVSVMVCQASSGPDAAGDDVAAESGNDDSSPTDSATEAGADGVSDADAQVDTGAAPDADEDGGEAAALADAGDMDTAVNDGNLSGSEGGADALGDVNAQ